MSDGRLPIEVELVFELMPCNAQRTTYGPGNPAKHPCGYFRKWGTYHGYDYETAGPPPQPGAKPNPKYEYLGRGRLVPEMLSGCRKAPIISATAKFPNSTFLRQIMLDSAEGLRIRRFRISN